MKKCPVCNRTYNDETLNFCLEDGAALIGNTQSAQNNFPQSASAQQSWQSNAPHNFAQSPPRKSKTWLWILGILGAVVIVSVVGAFGLLIAIGIAVGNDNENKNNRTNYNYNSSNRNVNSNANSSNKNVNSNSSEVGKLKYHEDDFSDWGVIDSQFGRGETKNGEFHVSSKKSDNFYVIIASQTLDDKYATNKATTKLTVRSVANASPHLGYGLVVHSAATPLKRDYAFVIRTDDAPSFRVVKHEDNNETELVKWTPASQIRTGTQTNELEVRSNGKQLQFYINGQHATSIADTSSGKGIVGIYTSGTPTVAFSNLKIYEN